MAIGWVEHESTAPQLVIVKHWEGLSQGGAYQAEWHHSIPPDPVIAMANGYVIVVVNKSIKVFDEDGNEVLDDMDQPMEADLDDFFGVGPLDLAPYDPRIFFDADEDRFVMCALLGTGDIGVAWSEVSTHADFPDLADWEMETAISANWDTLGDWDPICGNSMNPMEDIAIDQPSFGYDRTAWYVSSFKRAGLSDDISVNVFHTFDKPGGTSPIGITFSNNWDSDWCLNIDAVQGAETTRAVEHFDQPLADDSGDPSPFFVGVVRAAENGCSGAGDPPHNLLRIVSIEDPLGTPTRHEVKLETSRCFDATGKWSIEPKDANDQWTAAGDSRITNAVYREDGANRYLYCVHPVRRTISVNEEDVEQIVVRWYKIDMKDWPGGQNDPEIVASGQIDGGVNDNGTPEDPDDDKPVHLFMPAICVNENHDIGIVMAQSSENEFISIQAWARLDAGTELGPEEIIVSEVGTVLVPTQGDREFGDYFDIALDDGGLDFWVIGECIKEGTGTAPDFWATEVAQVQIQNN
jgi:hypothetical protein